MRCALWSGEACAAPPARAWAPPPCSSSTAPAPCTPAGSPSAQRPTWNPSPPHACITKGLQLRHILLDVCMWIPVHVDPCACGSLCMWIPVGPLCDASVRGRGSRRGAGRRSSEGGGVLGAGRGSRRGAGRRDCGAAAGAMVPAQVLWPYKGPCLIGGGRSQLKHILIKSAAAAGAAGLRRSLWAVTGQHCCLCQCRLPYN